MSLKKITTTQIVILVTLALPITLTIFFWKIGILNSPNSEKVTIAIISLGGVFITSIIGIMGTLIKQTFDKRTLAINEQAETRTKLENEQAEKRLRLETAIKIIELIKSDGNEFEAKETKEASLLALSSLGEIELALNLTENYWTSGLIDSKIAVKIINSALLIDTREIQVRASDILNDNYSNLIYLKDGKGYYHFPETVYLKWNKQIDYNVRRVLMITLMKCLAEKPRLFWHSSVLNQFAYNFYKIITIDPSERLRLGASYCLQVYLDSMSYVCFHPPDMDSIDSIEILKKANELVPSKSYLEGKVTQKVVDLSDKIASR